MYQKPISKDFLKNINLVLSGETTQKFPLSAELQKHAKMAANELKNIFFDEGVSSAEKKRDVIRQNLVAGLKECNCDATEKLVAAYEDLVWENYNEKDEEQAETVETEEVAEEEVEIAESTVSFMLDKKVVLRRKSMKDGEAKAAAAEWKKSGVLPFKFDKSAAEKYRMPWKSKLVDGGVTWGPGYKKGQTRDVVVEQVETAETDAVTEGAMKAAMENWLTSLPMPAVKEFFGVAKKFFNPKDKKKADAKNLEILKKYKIKPLINDPSHRESLNALSCCLDMLIGGQGEMPWESVKVDGDSIEEANHIIEVTGALTDFVKELNEDEVRILKNLLAKH